MTASRREICLSHRAGCNVDKFVLQGDGRRREAHLLRTKDFIAMTFAVFSIPGTQSSFCDKRQRVMNTLQIFVYIQRSFWLLKKCLK